MYDDDEVAVILAAPTPEQLIGLADWRRNDDACAPTGAPSWGQLYAAAESIQFDLDAKLAEIDFG
jgi:hypothetical protein